MPTIAHWPVLRDGTLVPLTNASPVAIVASVERRSSTLVLVLHAVPWLHTVAVAVNGPHALGGALREVTTRSGP